MSTNNKNIAKFCTSGDNSELHNIREFIIAQAQEFGFKEDESQKIALAVDEACSNLVRHAYKLASDKQICLEVENDSNDFIIKILDEGAPFDPLDNPTPDMNDYFKNFKRGGLGIHIMRLIMDEIHYYPATEINLRNMLYLKKSLKSGPGNVV